MLPDLGCSISPRGSFRTATIQISSETEQRSSPSSSAVGEPETTGQRTRSARQLSDATYEVCGDVVAEGERWRVIDLGDLQVSQEARPSDTAVGSWVRGTNGLGLDPFSYFERFHAVAGIPPLVYTWSVDEIQPQTAPFVRARPSWRISDG